MGPKDCVWKRRHIHLKQKNIQNLGTRMSKRECMNGNPQEWRPLSPLVIGGTQVMHNLILVSTSVSIPMIQSGSHIIQLAA